VQPDSEDKRICSAAWLKDEDISRFIKWVCQVHRIVVQDLHELQI
jgi:hypothetical protein